MQHNARIGGILSIVAGAFGIFYLIGTVLIIIFMAYEFNDSYYDYGRSSPDEILTVFVVIYAVIGGFFTLVGIMGIVGGIFALKKMNWGLALAGAIAGSLTFFPCGIAAIIFVCLGKDEFKGQGVPELSG